MHIRFKPSQANAAVTATTVLTTLAYAATASANTVMTQDAVRSYADSSGYGDSGNILFQDYATISNSEAGGWTVNTYDLGDLGAGGTLNDFTLELESASPKSSRNYTNFRKIIDLTGEEISGTTTAGFITAKVGFKDSVSDTVQRQNLHYQGSSQTNSVDPNVQSHFPFSSKKIQDDAWWNISVTSKYCYIWMQTAGSNNNYMAGVADFKSANYSWLQESVAGYNHAGVFLDRYDSGEDWVTTKLSLINNAAGAQDTSLSSARLNQNGQSTSNGSVGYPTAFRYFQTGPHLKSSNIANSGAYYRSMVDNKGQQVGSLVPFHLINPFYGIPYTSIEGIAWYTMYSNPESAVSIGMADRVVRDQDGTKWVLVYGSSPVMKAIRSA